MKLFQRRGRASHSLFELNHDSIHAWVSSLPRANLSATSKALYKALDELSQLDCSFQNRLEALEALRPSVHVLLRGLQPRYLNTSVVLPEKAKSVVRISNIFNTLLADNYLRAAQDILNRSWAGRFRQSLAQAVHREISERSQLLVRSYLLYQNEPATFWENLHTCYRTACQHKLNEIHVSDPVFGHCSVKEAYLRPMLFVGAHPYQLPQKSQLTLYNALHQLAEKANIRSTDLQTCCFLFNPAGKEPPIYRELCDDTEGWLGIDTSELIKTLSPGRGVSAQQTIALSASLPRYAVN